MDLTPQDVRDVQFREKMRGYHQDDVDQYFEGSEHRVLRTNYRSARSIVAAGNAVMSGRGAAAIASTSRPRSGSFSTTGENSSTEMRTKLENRLVVCWEGDFRPMAAPTDDAVRRIKATTGITSADTCRSKSNGLAYGAR